MQKHELHDLEDKIKELRDKQASYDDVLTTVNGLWNQVLFIDMHICACVCVCICALCACVLYIHTYTHKHTFSFCVCVHLRYSWLKLFDCFQLLW